MKAWLLSVLLLLIFGDNLHSQNLHDWFLPTTGTNNKSVFYTPIPSGSKSAITHTIYYALKKDTLEMVICFVVQGVSSSFHSYHFTVGKSELRFFHEHFENGGRSPTQDKNFIDPQVYFKMPSPGQKVWWSHNQVGGDLMKCVAYYSTIMVGEKSRECIKVERVAYSSDGKIVDAMSTAEYYLKGLGLYKVELLKSKKIFMLLDYQTYDETITQYLQSTR